MQQAIVPTMPRLWMLMMTMLLMLMTAPEGLQAQTTCSAVTIIRLSSRNTYVTCHFGKTLSDYGFNVQFFSNGGAETDTILACNRLKSGGLGCRKDSGVEFDEHQEIRDHLTFTRDAALNRVGSQYLCQVVRGKSAQRCTVTEIDIPEVRTARPKTITTADPDGSDPDGSDHSSTIIGIAVLILLFLIGTIVTIVIGCLIVYRKRKRIPKWWSEQTMGFKRSEGIEDPEQPTHKDSPQTSSLRIPEGWPKFFYNMGWREALKEETKKKEDDKGANPSPAAPEQPQSSHHKQDPDTEANLRGETSRQPLLQPTAAPGEQCSPTSKMPHGRGQLELQVHTPPVAGPPLTDETKEERKSREKAEKKKAQKEKREAEQKAKEIMQNAEKEAKRLKEEAKGKSTEEQKEAERTAKSLKKTAEATAKQMKEELGNKAK